MTLSCDASFKVKFSLLEPTRKQKESTVNCASNVCYRLHTKLDWVLCLFVFGATVTSGPGRPHS